MKRWYILCPVLLLLCLPWGGQAAIRANAPAELVLPTKYVALTFDDGPRRSTTEALLDGLRQRGASATFFLVGEQLAGNEDLVLRMAREGHQIGNHTWSHKSLLEGDEETFREEIQRTEAALEQLLGGEGYWLRPPYGQIPTVRMKALAVPLVKWSVDPRDWENRNTQAVVQAALKAVEPGSVILLHDIYPTSVAAALELVDRLGEQGYVFVTVEELLALYGITPRGAVMYRAAVGQITSSGSP